MGQLLETAVARHIGTRSRPAMDLNALTIRPLTAEDYEAVAALWRAAGLPVKPRGRDGREAFLRQLPYYRTTFLAAEFDGRLVGVVLGTHDWRKGWINRLAVHPDFRRRGIARRLIDACAAALRAEGIEIIAALVEDGNHLSRRAFERAGYVADVPVHYLRKRFREDI